MTILEIAGVFAIGFALGRGSAWAFDRLMTYLGRERRAGQWPRAPHLAEFKHRNGKRLPEDQE